MIVDPHGTTRQGRRSPVARLPSGNSSRTSRQAAFWLADSTESGRLPERCEKFSWARARRELDGLPEGALNIAYECVDRHATGVRGDQLAIRWLGRHGETRDFTFATLRALTNRFADVLDRLGVGRGDRVFVLADRIPELYVSVLGTLKHGSVACTMFSAFGPEPIRQRMAIGAGQVLVTTERLYRRKVAPIRDELPELEHVLLVGSKGEPTEVPGTVDYSSLIDEAGDDFEVAATKPNDIALLHFTSGTTGTPKGAVHAHEAVLAHLVTGRLALDLHADDVFWCGEAERRASVSISNITSPHRVRVGRDSIVLA